MLVAHSPYAWQADVDTTVVVPALSLALPLRRRPASARRARGSRASPARMALLAVAFWTPLHHLGLHYLLTAHLLAERDPRRVGAAARGARDLAADGARRSRGARAWRAARPPGRRTAALARELLRLARAAGLRRRARASGVADPPRARVLLRDRRPRLVAARAGRAATARVGRARRRTRSRRSCSPRRSACCSRCCRGRSTTSTSHVPTRVWGLTPLADQEIAGVTMAAEQAVVLFVVFLFWFRRFLAEEACAT